MDQSQSQSQTGRRSEVQIQIRSQIHVQQGWVYVDVMQGVAQHLFYGDVRRTVTDNLTKVSSLLAFFIATGHGSMEGRSAIKNATRQALFVFTSRDGADRQTWVWFALQSSFNSHLLNSHRSLS